LVFLVFLVQPRSGGLVVIRLITTKAHLDPTNQQPDISVFLIFILFILFILA